MILFYSYTDRFKLKSTEPSRGGAARTARMKVTLRVVIRNRQKFLKCVTLKNVSAWKSFMFCIVAPQSRVKNIIDLLSV